MLFNHPSQITAKPSWLLCHFSHPCEGLGPTLSYLITKPILFPFLLLHHPSLCKWVLPAPPPPPHSVVKSRQVNLISVKCPIPHQTSPHACPPSLSSSLVVFTTVFLHLPSLFLKLYFPGFLVSSFAFTLFSYFFDFLPCFLLLLSELLWTSITDNACNFQPAWSSLSFLTPLPRHTKFSRFPYAFARAHKCTMVQNNQESRRKYWATYSSVCSFTRTAHSLALELVGK